MRKVAFPFDSYVSPLYDLSAKKVDEYMLAYDESKVRDAFQFTVADLVSRKGASFELVYDFGEMMSMSL